MKAPIALLALSSACLIPVTTAVAGKPSSKDATAPTVTMATPGQAATVAGVMTVAGTAKDNVAVGKIELAVDGGAFKPATGTTSWSGAIDTKAYADGSHVIKARATDRSGNVATAARTVTFANAPAPAPDTTPPTVAITSPAPSSTVSGYADVAGTAADDAGVAKVEVNVDNGAWSLAGGTASWTWAWNTTAFSDGGHTITARATDAAGNVAEVQQSHQVQNAAPAPAPLPAGVKEQLITPEGVTIRIASDVDAWNARQVYDLLRPNAHELSLLGPSLKIEVQTRYASQTTSAASATDGVYDAFRSTIYLKASPESTFTSRPEEVLAHEYGHSWSMYHYYLTRQADWSSWIAARGLATETRLDSTYNWSRTEMIADDYRLLFGTPAAAQGAYINSQAADPRTIEGLTDFFTGRWAGKG